VAEARARYGLDRPVLAQYADWLSHAIRFDFGRSMANDRPVGELIPERAANTALLAGAALLFATVVGLPLGVVSGSRPSGALSAAIRTFSVVFLSLPPLLTSLFLSFSPRGRDGCRSAVCDRPTRRAGRRWISCVT